MSVVLREPPNTTGSRERFWADVPFLASKAVGKKGDLILRGYASTWVEDRDGEYVDPKAFDGSLPLYLAKNPIMLWQHNHDWPLGQITKAEVDEHGLEVEGYVRKPTQGEEPWRISAYNDIAAGIVKTFSIGGSMLRDIRAGKPVIIDVELWEISCVSVPSNPDSIYAAAVKAIKGEHRPGLHQKAIDQMAQVLGLQEVSDPELARMDGAQLRERYTMLSELYKRAGKRAPDYEQWRTVSKRVVEANSGVGSNVLVDAKDVIEVTRQVYGMVPVQADTKAGRVLSKANENKLATARDNITAVLEQLAKDDPPADDDKGPQLPVVNGTARRKATGELVWGPEDGFQDLCTDLREQLNPPGDWRYDVLDITTGLDKCLIADWRSDEYWVAPFDIGDDGEPVLGMPNTWVQAERGWVQSTRDAVELAAKHREEAKA